MGMLGSALGASRKLLGVGCIPKVPHRELTVGRSHWDLASLPHQQYSRFQGLRDAVPIGCTGSAEGDKGPDGVGALLLTDGRCHTAQPCSALRDLGLLYSAGACHEAVFRR